MFFNKIKKIFAVSLLSVVCLPAMFIITMQAGFLPIGSAFALEQDYPEVGGVKLLERTNQKVVSIPHLIKYADIIAIIGALVIIVGALIYAGIAYLYSAGKPQKTADAKKRLKAGLWGLLILAVSYLALTFLNPELTILKIERKVVPQGVVLITQQGFDLLNDSANTFLTINDLVDENLAFTITTDAPDLRNILGPLTVQEMDANRIPQKLNFGSIPIFGIVLWGKSADEARVFAYPFENFALTKQGLPAPNPTSAHIYDKKGLVNQTGALITNQSGEPINPAKPPITKDGVVLYVIPLQNYTAQTEYLSVATETYQTLTESEIKGLSEKTATLPRPPLSLAVKFSSPGIYLSSLENEELPLLQSQNNLEDLSFDKKAAYVRIQNNKKNPVLTNVEDILDSQTFGNRSFAVLFSEKDFQGSSKVFFPEIKPDNLGTVAVEFNYNGTPKTTILALPDFVSFFWNKAGNTGKLLQIALAEYEEMMNNVVFTDRLTRGNVVENTANAVNPPSGELSANPSLNRYGKLDSVSSVAIYQYAPDVSVCESVALCTDKNGTAGKGECLVYLNPNSPDFLKLRQNWAVYPLPLYEPVNLPEQAYVYAPHLKTNATDPNKFTFLMVDFNDNIRSIEIKPAGGCLVGLFNNKLKFEGARGEFSGWDNNKTGMSRFFTNTDYDLEKDPIGQCGGVKALEKFYKKPCASAVVVYPIISPVASLAGMADVSDPVVYKPTDAAAKVKGVLKRFDPTKGSLVANIESAVRSDSAFYNYMKNQKITLTNGNTESIDPCMFVQMMTIQESLGNPNACGVDKGNSIGCGLMQLQCLGTRSCAFCGNCSSPIAGDLLSVNNNLNWAIDKIMANFAGKCGSSQANLSCNMAKTGQFWPYLIINYNAGAGANTPSKDCKEPCSAYAGHSDGGCFLPPSLQGSAFPTKVECPIRRNDYNITYGYILTVRDGYSYLRALYNANPNRRDIASCQ